MDKILFFLPHSVCIRKSVSVLVVWMCLKMKSVLAYNAFMIMEIMLKVFSKFKANCILPLNYCISYVNELTTALVESLFAPHADI